MVAGTFTRRVAPTLAPPSGEALRRYDYVMTRKAWAMHRSVSAGTGRNIPAKTDHVLVWLAMSNARSAAERERGDGEDNTEKVRRRCRFRGWGPISDTELDTRVRGMMTNGGVDENNLDINLEHIARACHKKDKMNKQDEEPTVADASAEINDYRRRLRK